MITRELIVLLNTQYPTPFDREDIYHLATEIDDVVDYLEEASDLLGLYGVEMPRATPVEQCGIIVKAVAEGDRLREPERDARRAGGAVELKLTRGPG